MKRTFSRVVSYVLVFTMAATMNMGVFAFATEVQTAGNVPALTATNAIASGTCGAAGNEANVTWVLDADGTLTISGTGAMADYLYGGAPWYKNNEYTQLFLKVKGIVIGEGVTSIGDCAFYRCQLNSSVTIPSTVQTIGNHAFEENIRLQSLTIPEGVNSIGAGAFKNCVSESYSGATGLKSIVLPESLLSMGNAAFSGCEALKQYTIYSKTLEISADSGWRYDRNCYLRKRRLQSTNICGSKFNNL